MDSFHFIKLFTFSLLLSWSFAAHHHIPTATATATTTTTTIPTARHHHIPTTTTIPTARHHIPTTTTTTIPTTTTATTTTATGAALPQPSSAFLAADTLRIRGYSIFASLLVSISSSTNFSGTLLAPPDFAFSFASTKILNNHRPPPRPSVPVLLYHTLRPPLILTWPTISSRDDGDELRTFYNNNCLYLFKSSRAGEVSISSSPFTNPIATVKIRQPDLYVDEHLIVHGIDGVLNPSFATRCSVTYSDPTADTVPLQVNRVFLDRTMRALRRNGYSVVASAMSIRRSDLLPLTSVTVLAVSDEHLFMTPGGFHYDFRHHVVPTRQRFADLARMASGGVEFYTLAPNRTVLVVSNGGAVTVDGVPVGMREVYHNRWMVVISVLSSLDDVADSQPASPPAAAADDSAAPSLPPLPAVAKSNGGFSRVPSPAPVPADRVPSPAPIPRVPANGHSRRVPSPAPIPRAPRVPSPAPNSRVSSHGNSPRVPSPAPIPRASSHGKSPRVFAPAPSHWTKGKSHRVPSPSPAHREESEDRSPSPNSVEVPSPAAELHEDYDAPSSSPSPATEIEAPGSSPVPSPASDEVDVVHCDLNVVISHGVEGGDLLCPDRPERAARQLREAGSLNGDDVEGYQPLDAHAQDGEDFTHFDEVKVSEHVNIADDVFFYT